MFILPGAEANGRDLGTGVELEFRRHYVTITWLPLGIRILILSMIGYIEGLDEYKLTHLSDVTLTFPGGGFDGDVSSR